MYFIKFILFLLEYKSEFYTINYFVLTRSISMIMTFDSCFHEICYIWFCSKTHTWYSHTSPRQLDELFVRLSMHSQFDETTLDNTPNTGRNHLHQDLEILECRLIHRDLAEESCDRSESMASPWPNAFRSAIADHCLEWWHFATRCSRCESETAISDIRTISS